MILAVTLNPAVDYTVFGGDFRVYETNRGRDLPPDPGGKGNNAVRICRILGFDTVATGIVGGFTGRYIEERLAREGIAADFLWTESPTRITVAFISEPGGRDTKIVPQGPEMDAKAPEKFLSHYRELMERYAVDIVLLCGSLPRGVPDDYYATLIEAARERGIPAIVDTSGAPLGKSIEHRPLMVKPNLDEACELFHCTGFAEAVEHLRALSGSVDLVSLTMGGEGAIFISGGKTIEVRPPRITATSPVGAGDAFVAGLACAYVQYGFDLESLCAWSTAAGACTAQAAGITWEIGEFRKMLKRIEHTRI